MPARELDALENLSQQVNRSYPTRCNSADFADMVPKLWWKILDFAALNQSSVAFFSLEEPETAASRWSRAKTRVEKVVKGLSKDEKAQKLAYKYWLEAIDPFHRYGRNLHLYYDEWLTSHSTQPFFYWLDFGDGKEVSLEECPRIALQDQRIEYLAPREREAYEVIIEDGKLVYRHSGHTVDTPEGTKWIFVLSTSRKLYVGQKRQGSFQHSSFVAGGAIIAAGRLVSSNGTLHAIWSYSGHYRPSEENFLEIISFLEEHQVDLTHVKTFPLDDDIPPPCKIATNEQPPKSDAITSYIPTPHNYNFNTLKINAKPMC